MHCLDLVKTVPVLPSLPFCIPVSFSPSAQLHPNQVGQKAPHITICDLLLLQFWVPFIPCEVRVSLAEKWGNSIQERQSDSEEVSLDQMLCFLFSKHVMPTNNWGKRRRYQRFTCFWNVKYSSYRANCQCFVPATHRINLKINSWLRLRHFNKDYADMQLKTLRILLMYYIRKWCGL